MRFGVLVWLRFIWLIIWFGVDVLNVLLCFTSNCRWLVVVFADGVVLFGRLGL